MTLDSKHNEKMKFFKYQKNKYLNSSKRTKKVVENY